MWAKLLYSGLPLVETGYHNFLTNWFPISTTIDHRVIMKSRFLETIFVILPAKF